MGGGQGLGEGFRVIVRSAAPADIPSLQAIYAHHVMNGAGTFEETPPTNDEFAERLGKVLDLGLPYLVAEAEGEILGFAYAGPFRMRSAYRYTVEDSVYVAPGREGKGVGKALLGAVIEACEALGMRQIIAVIGDSRNAGSVGVHRACGFTEAGAVKGVGFKHGRFLDIVIMQRALGGGEKDLPTVPGLTL